MWLYFNIRNFNWRSTHCPVRWWSVVLSWSSIAAVSSKAACPVNAVSVDLAQSGLTTNFQNAITLVTKLATINAVSPGAAPNCGRSTPASRDWVGGRYRRTLVYESSKPRRGHTCCWLLSLSVGSWKKASIQLWSTFVQIGQLNRAG